MWVFLFFATHILFQFQFDISGHKARQVSSRCGELGKGKDMDLKGTARAKVQERGSKSGMGIGVAILGWWSE